MSRTDFTRFAGAVVAGLISFGAFGSALADTRIECPPSLVVPCLGDVPAAAEDVAGLIAQGGSASSDCGEPKIDHEDSASGTCPTVITRTYIGTDGCGGFATCDQLITISDTEAPRITCPEGRELECGVQTKETVTAEDNCHGLAFSAEVTGGTGDLASVSIVDNGGGSFLITINGTASAEVTFTVSDGCNSDSCKVTFFATCEVAEGCTPGYWKNHTKKWDNAADPVAAAVEFTTATKFNTYFGLTPAQSGFANTANMLTAISTGGGGGFKLARHGVAGLLSTGAGLNYTFPTGVTDFDGLVTAIHDAYVNKVFEPLAGQIAAANEAGCPLN